MSAFFPTKTINGRICTGVPKTAGAGDLKATSTSISTSTSTSTTSTSSSSLNSSSSSSSTTTTPTSTTFSTSAAPASTSQTTVNVVDPIINAPSTSITTSATQESFTSTTSSTSSQSATSSVIPISSSTETSALIASSSVTSSLESEGLDVSSTTSITDSTSPSSTPVQDVASEFQTNDNTALTSASSVPPTLSTPASGTISSGTTSSTSAVSAPFKSPNAGAGSTIGAENSSNGNSISTQTTVAVAGGVIGGLALISIIAFLFWFWRKRHMKKRRSTLLTPLNTDGAYRGGEKGPYIISRNSLGPTTIPEKMRAVVGYNYSKLRGRVNGLVNRSPKPSVDLNRGNSQFGPPDTPASRSASRAGATSNDATTTKGRLVDWWERLTEDSNFNWKLRNDSQGERPRNDTYTSLSNTTQPARRGSQPNYLTLSSIEEDQQQRGSSNNPRRSQSLGNDNFLGGLGLNFDVENPFADSNVMSHDSAKVMPLAVSAGGIKNPFSDANAIPPPARNNGSSSTAGGPTTYVQNIRRSRGYSASAANMQPPGGVAASRMPSSYRESNISIETTDTRRNKFRSDPFDLDRPELLAQSSAPGPRGGARDSGRDSRYSRPGNGRGLPDMPRPTHKRTESFTSKYSSGVSSMGEWSDPGPDVGPAAGRWAPSPDSMLGRQPSTSREKDPGGGTQRSVGKAL